MTEIHDGIDIGLGIGRHVEHKLVVARAAHQRIVTAIADQGVVKAGTGEFIHSGIAGDGQTMGDLGGINVGGHLAGAHRELAGAGTYDHALDTGVASE